MLRLFATGVIRAAPNGAVNVAAQESMQLHCFGSSDCVVGLRRWAYDANDDFVCTRTVFDCDSNTVTYFVNKVTHRISNCYGNNGCAYGLI